MEPQDAPATGASDEAALVRARKAALRRATRVACQELTAADRAVASAAAEARLWRLPELRAAHTLAVYAARTGEVDLSGLTARARERGMRTLLPRVRGDELDLVVAATSATLAPGYRGIAEPTGPAIDLDHVEAVVLPGVAFDPTGGRLGQGGGHYDRLLARLPAATIRIGVCFACQLAPSVPREPHDEVLDLVVTDRGTYRTAARRPPAEG